jgi:hypothetical protein
VWGNSLDRWLSANCTMVISDNLSFLPLSRSPFQLPALAIESSGAASVELAKAFYNFELIRSSQVAKPRRLVDF